MSLSGEKILEYPQDKLPADAQFKGYEEVIVQDLKLVMMLLSADTRK